MKAAWIVILSVSAGIAGGLLGRPQVDEWLMGDCCANEPRSAAAVGCPVHFDNGKIVTTDDAGLDRLRRAMRDGLFEQWIELGRAPTPEEFGARLGLDQPAANALLDEMEVCGETAGVGIRRVPDSGLIAIAWPLANVPTGITVTVEGGKPVQARCAIDSLGVSKMLGRGASIDAVTQDGNTKLHVVVDGDKLVSSDPPDAIVFKGASCDEMLFFSSQAGLDAWKKKHGVEGGEVYTMAEAVAHGASIFGKLTDGLGS